jgi:hypothetical protein
MAGESQVGGLDYLARLCLSHEKERKEGRKEGGREGEKEGRKEGRRKRKKRKYTNLKCPVL